MKALTVWIAIGFILGTIFLLSALAYALLLSPNIRAVAVATDPKQVQRLQDASGRRELDHAALPHQRAKKRARTRAPVTMLSSSTASSTPWMFRTRGP